jgi:hypothetical protein
VLLARFILPLFIPKYPLPAILLCFLLDAVDQAILQPFTGFGISAYQSYDKALDIFYLSIAMLTTLRNWNNFHAVLIARALFYLRLLGVLVFELTGYRFFLLILPNAFEYFFIFYEVIRGYWSTDRIDRSFLIRGAILIWFLIKIPQEYWLHVARLDVSDMVKNWIFRNPASRLISEVATHLIILAVVLLLISACIIILRRILRPAHHPLVLAAAPLPENIDESWERDRLILYDWKLFDRHLLEKVMLVGFISVIFARMLPVMNTSPVELFAGIAVFVLVNTLLRLQIVQRGRSVESVVISFILLAAINALLAFLAHFLIKRGILSLPGQQMLFFLLLLTLIVTLYDRWRPVFEVRFQSELFKY